MVLIKIIIILITTEAVLLLLYGIFLILIEVLGIDEAAFRKM